MGMISSWLAALRSVSYTSDDVDNDIDDDDDPLSHMIRDCRLWNS